MTAPARIRRGTGRVSTAEARARLRGIRFVDPPDDAPAAFTEKLAEKNADEMTMGYMMLWPADNADGPGAQVTVIHPLDLTAAGREALADAAEAALDRWFEHGPALDGWQRRESDHGWQLWLRAHQLYRDAPVATVVELPTAGRRRAGSPGRRKAMVVNLR